MENADSSTEVKPAAKRKRRPPWSRFIHQVIRQRRKREAQKNPESTADKAARRTANATIAIAGFTLVLVVVSYFQWKEIHDGSTDTHNLAIAAGNQATWTQKLSDHMQTQADRTKDLADRMKDQADETKIIAGQAVIQANAARSAADTASSSLRPWIKVTGVDLRPGVGGDSGIKTLMFHWPKSGLQVFPQYAGKELPPMLQVEVSIENVGHSPAENIEIVPEMFFHKFDSNKWHDNIAKEEERFCSSVKSRATGPDAVVVFPSEPTKNDMGLSGIAKSSDITMIDGIRYSSAALLFCVNYTGEAGIRYQTQAWYGLYEDNNISIPLGLDVNADRLRLIREANGDHAK